MIKSIILRWIPRKNQKFSYIMNGHYIFKKFALYILIMLCIAFSVGCTQKNISTEMKITSKQEAALLLTPTLGASGTPVLYENKIKKIKMNDSNIYYMVDIQSDNKIKIQISSDNKTSWNTYYISGCPETPIDYLIGFVSSKFGWLIINGDIGLGSQNHYIYITEDSGKTWRETGNTNNTRSKMLSGAGFSQKKIGFLNFIYTDGSSNVPEIYQSLNSGKTWRLLKLKLPKIYADCTAQALSPTFNGTKGIMPIKVTNEKKTKIINCYSYDSGKTWSFKKNINNK